MRRTVRCHQLKEGQISLKMQEKEEQVEYKSVTFFNTQMNDN